MSLLERMNRPPVNKGGSSLFATYGINDNPFPAAGRPSGHPRLESALDDEIEQRFRHFETPERPSQVVLVQGTQGVGKTNLLNYYEEQFRQYYEQDESFYIIRYYPDPEPSFDAIVRRIFQSLDEPHFERLANALANASNSERDAAKEVARSLDVRIVLNGIERIAREDGDVSEAARLALEWFGGLRVLKRHREVLGVNYRLDTVEARTQALRDITYVSEKLGLLKGMLLLLDELEKQDYSMSKTPVLRFLSAIRALIDALPRCMFLILAMTPQARLRYFAMLPALAGRLQDVLDIRSIGSFVDAKNLYDFYVEKARATAQTDPSNQGEQQGNTTLFSQDELEDVFNNQVAAAEERGTEGVTPRNLLHALYKAWNERVDVSQL